MRKQLKLVLFFSGLIFFFSENNVKAILYGCCLTDLYASMIFLLPAVSVISDIYHSDFVGITFVSMAVIIFLKRNFHQLLHGVSFFAKAYCVCRILLIAEIISDAATILLNGAVHFHFSIIVRALLFYSLYEFSKERGYVE